ncbi:IS1595 family transposase, partial [bacterium]|nr:IS1595 family transposase [bacterium]
KCGKHGKFSKIRKLPAWQCAWCGHHVHPMAGTPFEHTTTPLQKWFYAMYLFTTSRHGVPAKELQRQLSVTYKTAWRMGHEIRKYLGQVDGDDGLSGHVEIDETFIGGKGGHKDKHKKTIVMGMLQRNGMLMTKVVPDCKKSSLLPHIRQNIAAGSLLNTDEHVSYRQLANEGFQHVMVEHGKKQYVKGIHHVNGLESFWGILKRSIKGTYIHVSEKHMPKYLAEFEYRHNMRKHTEFMFERLLLSF